MSWLIRAESPLKHWSVLAVALATSLTFAACDDDDDLDIIDPGDGDGNVIVAAFRDTTVNFQNLTTFALPDTVVHFAPATGTPVAVSRQFDDDILARVRQNLLARGYTEATDPANVAPSFVVLVGTTATENSVAFVSYSWFSQWGFYSGFDSFDPGFDSSWGIIYPWAPTAGITSFERGTIVVDLIPTLTVQPLGKTINSAWAGIATGLLDGTTSTAEVNAVIDQMFVLSPYLRHIP
jgi:hypothetical protein